jgi:hypothetical protein
MVFPKKLTSMHYVWIVAISVLLLKAVFFIVTPLRNLGMTTWIIDDAFIEITIGHNIAAGRGFTYDWVHATSGAPLLWVYILAIPFLFLSFAAGIKASFILSGIFGMLATIIIYVLAKRVTGNTTTAWIAFILATFTGNAFLEAVNGMDTSIFAFLTLGGIAAYFCLPRTGSPFRRGAITGLLIGLSLLVRADGIFVGMALGLLMLWRWWKEPAARRDTMYELIGFVTMCALCLAFFMGFQYSRTGSPMPANQVGRRGLALAWHGFSYDDFSLPRYLRIVIWNFFQLEKLVTVAIGSSLLGFTGLVWCMHKKETRTFAIMMSIYVGCFFFLLIAYQWYFADFHGLRYINAPVHLFCIAMAVLFTALPAARFRTASITLLTLSTIILSWYGIYNLSNTLRWGKYLSFIGRPSAENIKAFMGPSDWIKENIPPGTIVGVRDYGRFTIFTELPVQDLAGNIDPAMTNFTKNNDGEGMKEYLRSRNVQYLYIPSLDVRADQVYQLLHAHLPLEMVVMEEFPDSPTKLYRINWEE